MTLYLTLWMCLPLSECEVSPTGSCLWPLGPQTLVLFLEASLPLGYGVQLEDVHLCGMGLVGCVLAQVLSWMLCYLTIPRIQQSPMFPLPEQWAILISMSSLLWGSLSPDKALLSSLCKACCQITSKIFTPTAKVTRGIGGNLVSTA